LNDTLSSHWAKLYLYNDILTITNPLGVELISNINAALLNDTNWYFNVTFAANDFLDWGRDKGCDFI